MILMAVLIINSLLSATNALSKCIYKRHSPNCTHIVAYLGSSTTLNCSSILSPRQNGSTFSHITWYKFGRPLSDVTFRSMSEVFKHGNHMLWLEGLLHADAGYYVCATFIDGKIHDNKTFRLCVEESRSSRPFILNKKHDECISRKKGEDVELKCKARSSSITYFQWFYTRNANWTNYMSELDKIVLKNPRLIPGYLNNGTRIHQDSLWIYNVSNKDSGWYICLVFTKHGKNDRGIQLSVIQEPLESSTELEVQHVSKPIDNANSMKSKIPMIILIALPAGLFILSCSAVIRSLEKSRQARLAKKNETSAPSEPKDESENQLPAITIHSNFDYFNHIQIRTTDHESHIDDVNEQASASLETDSAEVNSDIEIDESSYSPLDVLSNISRQSSCQLTSTEAPITTSPPPELSSSSGELDLEWEGLDLVLPDGSEFVRMSKEADV